MTLFHLQLRPTFTRPRFFTAILIILALSLGILANGCTKSSSEAAAKQKYHCPMHPTYVSDRPGDCPICNMKLVPIKDEKASRKQMAAAPAKETAHINPGQYYCPMDTHVVSNSPGVCPECNMKLIVKEETAAEQHAAYRAAAVPGRISISVSPDKRQTIGLTLAKVEKRDLSRVIRTTARVEHDETRDFKVAPRFGGWVHKLYVNYTGALVHEGQPLLTVYSPELFSSENEYLVAWRAAQAATNSSGGLSASAESLLEAARLRLSLLQIGEEEIRELEERGKPSAEIPFRAPFTGHVITKAVVEGASFQAGQTLYEVADLSHVWVRASVFEFEMPLVSVGQQALITFPYLNNRSFNAQVSFIYPHIDPQTRQGQIRLELDNPEHLIRPEMWANVEIKVDTGERLAIPVSALINTGQRYVAFVNGADEHLEPRNVEVGLKTDDYYEVISGLKEGAQVVSRALFLIDSESQLKAAIAGMASPGSHQH